MKRKLDIKGSGFSYFSLEELEKTAKRSINQLPFSIKILLEQILRNLDGKTVREQDLNNLTNWGSLTCFEKDIPFKPSRVVLQDFTGVPALVDLASLRSAVAAMKGDPAKINPLIPVDLIIDHSVQVDYFGSSNALRKNMDLEFERNNERYEFLKWGQYAFENLKVFPPGIGIIHQVNLEYLAKVVQIRDGVLIPDSLVGTDSHTTMINGLGVMGWGVGGIEAESAILGQPIYMKIPEVIGFKLTGALKSGTTATDLVLKIVQLLRKKGVVEKFVEFYGNGLSALSLANRATIANMAPEYGATMGFFPIDQETLSYLKATGRTQELIDRVEAYSKAQGIFRTDTTPDPQFTDIMELDLALVVPSLAGPRRPQDRLALTESKEQWVSVLNKPVSEGGFGVSEAINTTHPKLANGSVVIAAITSCTNTSNPEVMVMAGLLAKKATEKGLATKPWVKTSLAPGSGVVSDYLEKSKLMAPLNALGFHTVGYGCTTCIGNSGPLPPEIEKQIKENDLVVVSMLSGNRNFEGRINPLVKANFLASPPLVVAYAIAGRMDIDLLNEPMGSDQNGDPVFLRDIWPTQAEVDAVKSVITPEMYLAQYQNPDSAAPLWNAIQTAESLVYEWDEESTYIRNPPFFNTISADIAPLAEITDASVLALLGDSVTTDHISPAGSIAEDSPAAVYLKSHGVTAKNFNSYGSRRGNDEVMVRGTLANTRLRNLLNPDKEGGYTIYHPTGELLPIYDASKRYQADQKNLIIIAGAEYGTGSSRDWAAKGTYLLGVKAVIAKSFERIHRSNLVGMGVLPLQFKETESAEQLGITGKETFSILGINDALQPGQILILKFGDRETELICRLHTPVEIEYYKNGGILHSYLRSLFKA